MRARTIPASFGLLAAIFLITACQDPGSTDRPSRDAPTPSFSAYQDWDRDVYLFELTNYVPCLDEDVFFHVEVPYAIHTVISHAGTVNLNMRWGPQTPNTPMTYAVALTSGTVYEWRGNPILYNMHLAKGEVHQFQDVEKYVAENGDWIKLIMPFHVTVNANGVVTVDKGEPPGFECSIN